MNAAALQLPFALPQMSTLQTAELTVSRLRSDRFDLPPGEFIPAADAFSVIIQLRDFAAHTLWRGERVVHSGGHARSALAITDLQARWRCHHRSPFDNLRIHLPRTVLAQFAREHGLGPVSGLRNPAGGSDPVALALASALMPALERAQGHQRLFVDHVLVALLAHLAHTYGATPVRARAGGLAKWQEARATEFLVDNLQTNVSLTEVAVQCGLSRGYFCKAFKQTTGKTPHRWLLDYRIEQVQSRLMGTMPIAQIASDCGFSDQSHLTRVFGRIVGVPPSRWRSLHRT